MKKGQALLMLLVFVIIGVTVTSAAVVLVILNSESSQKIERGTIAYQIAESGVENALLRLLRDPNYIGESDLPVGDGTVTTLITGSNPYTVTATSKLDNFTRTIEVVVNYNINMTITSWKEIF